MHQWSNTPIIRRDTDPQTVQGPRARWAGAAPGHDVEEDAGIVGGPGDRPDVVHRGRKYGDAVERQRVATGLQAEDAAHSCRKPDRTGRVGRQRSKTETGRHRDAGPARRSTGKAVAIPRVAGRRIRQIEGRAAESKLMAVGLAERNSACNLHAGDDGRIG